MKILIDIDDVLYDRIIHAKSTPDLMGIEIVNSINAIKCGNILSDKEMKVKNDDAISRKQIFAFIDGLISDPDERKKGLDYIYHMSSVKQESKWIPVNERLPEDLEPVNITWVNHNPESYYADIKDKPFTATGVYFNGQWYWWSALCTDILAEYNHNYNDDIDDDIEIIAWQPLPGAYKVEQEE